MTTASLMPTLFVSHGAPLFALEPGETGPALAQWAAAQAPAPRAIVVMSPHWMARGPAVMTSPTPTTWHDFGGFPRPLYALQYPALGQPAVAQRVQDLLAQAGMPAQPDPQRPFDHGTWVPLMHLYPQADIPVVQVALPMGFGPKEVFAMGQALQSLRSEGILVMGSGAMTHNLGEFGAFDGSQAAPYAVEFSRWVEAAVRRGDATALLNYRELAPHAHRAHPTEDHFLPLFFTLGAAGWGQEGSAPSLDYLSREILYGMLSMDAMALH
ncbi:class III extradiol ring-cleavage dioxygenase [Curvibacter sp. APW13]|uniref:DODA-type extradiol aromatic ring-opening family dioxygenase n=1 Tax=Curvibacter sp. APW13 TaxID=3077236 RepID=UPI0028E00701|nr:class III extradiol ring-cleavage dioxygenase [Curvibacter sp. APW13]MDT8991827.1 class III extradiol ring-cleavage dioxygenase [Curvibacter sp. APW13]